MTEDTVSERARKDARWLRDFVRENTGLTGYCWDKRHRAERHEKDVIALTDRTITSASPAGLEANKALADELVKAARWVEKRAETRFDENGTREWDTNATYYEGRAGEIYEALDEEDEEIAAHLRELAAALREAAPVEDRLVEAITEIVAERRRQIEAEGWTAEHDDGHTRGAIAQAAADYAMPGQYPMPHSWAFKKADKPRRRQLVIAGALIVAEIERLDRAALSALDGGKDNG